MTRRIVLGWGPDMTLFFVLSQASIPRVLEHPFSVLQRICLPERKLIVREGALDFM